MIWDERTTFFAVYYGSVLVIGLVAMQLAYVFEKRAQRKHDGEAAK